MSHITHMPIPAPTASPLTIAMTGLSIASSAFGTRWTPSHRLFLPSSALGSRCRMRPTSPPEQNARPAPVTTTTFTLSSASASPSDLAQAQDVRQAPIAVALERLLAGPEAGDLLAHDGVGTLLLLLDQADQAVERVAERYMSDEGQEVSLVCQRGDRDAPPLIESPHQVFRRYADVVEEHLIELRLARDLSERSDGDARRLHVHEEEADGLVLGSFCTGPHEEEAPVGDVGHARPDLLAVDDEVAVVGHRAGLEVREVRARVGLGEALAPELDAPRPPNSRGQSMPT